MDKLLAVVSKAPVKTRRDDDFADRLSSQYSTALLVMFALSLSFTSWLGKPITCWSPKHFTGNHIKYANSYCWIANTYYLPMGERIPRKSEEDERQMIIYYQWLPWIMIIQAFFFYIPSLFWHSINDKAGVDADDILAAAATFQNAKLAERRAHTLDMVTKQMHRFLSRKTEQVRRWKLTLGTLLNCLCCRCCGNNMNSYLTVVFLLSKVLYFGNIMMQMFTLNAIFQTHYNIYPYEYFSFYKGNETANVDWANSPIFPRITMCDLEVRRLGNVHRYTLQCVLPLNLYVEKMYLFFWFWLVFLAVMTAGSFFIWLVRMLCRPDRLMFVRNHLKDGRLNDPKDKERSKVFVDDYLQQDGSFLLRLISHNTNHITTTEITGSLWDLWRSRSEKTPVPCIPTAPKNDDDKENIDNVPHKKKDTFHSESEKQLLLDDVDNQSGDGTN